MQQRDEYLGSIRYCMLVVAEKSAIAGMYGVRGWVLLILQLLLLGSACVVECGEDNLIPPAS